MISKNTEAHARDRPGVGGADVGLVSLRKRDVVLSEDSGEGCCYALVRFGIYGARLFTASDV